eukprot:890516_1
MSGDNDKKKNDVSRKEKYNKMKAEIFGHQNKPKYTKNNYHRNYNQYNKDIPKPTSIKQRQEHKSEHNTNTSNNNYNEFQSQQRMREYNRMKHKILNDNQNQSYYSSHPKSYVYKNDDNNNQNQSHYSSHESQHKPQP